MSANTAIHRVAMPANARTKKTTFTAMAKMMLVHSVVAVRRLRSISVDTPRRSSLISATSAVSSAVSEPAAPIAKPIVARASAGASLTPSPTMPAAPWVFISSPMRVSLSSGSRSAATSSMPT